MKGRIPSNIDLDKLVRDLKDKNGKELRKDTKQKLKEGMVYFLTLLTFEVVKKKNLKDGYKKLSNEKLEIIIGQKRPTIIRRILEQKGIIEVIPHVNHSESSGYRLTQKYCTGNFKEVEYSERIKNKLLQFQTNNEIEPEPDTESESNPEIIVDYPYLKEQFTKNDLRIKIFESYDEIRNVLIQLLNKSLRKKKYKTETIVTLLNLIGGYKHKLENFKVKDKEYNLKLSPSNLRFNSKVTSLKREFRKFLRVNGEELVEVDIKSSQPFLLSTILNPNFTESVVVGYNLHTIYPDLYKEFQNVKSFIPSNTPERTEYILGVHFTPESVFGLKRFIEYNFENDFYENILVNGRLISDSPTLTQKINLRGRSYVKDHVMNYLFNRNEIHRHDDLIIEKINSLFPELTYFIEEFNSIYGKSKLSLLLQRTESYLVLNKTCGYINKTYPQIPFFTIHDSILTTKQYSSKVKDILIDVISVLTDKNPIVSVKDNVEGINVDETWKKVNISSDVKFDKQKYSISKVDIKKGLSLITDQQLQTKVKEVIKPYMKNFQ